MPSFLSRLGPPGSKADPRETLRWVRRVELVSGLVSVASGLALWGAGWWHWVLVAFGLVGLSPWPGVKTIIGRAPHDPGVLVSDPDRRRARARLAGAIVVPGYLLVGLVAGYVAGG